MPPPRFRPHSLEDSLFLPRCGHALRSHFAPGAGKWGDCRMTIKANRRTALLLATGLFVCLAGSSQAAGTDNANAGSAAPLALNKYAKHSAHHGKNYAHRKSGKQVQKSADNKDAATDVAADNS